MDAWQKGHAESNAFEGCSFKAFSSIEDLIVAIKPNGEIKLLVAKLSEPKELARLLEAKETLWGLDSFFIVPEGFVSEHQNIYDIRPRVVLSEVATVEDIHEVVSRMVSREKNRIR